ncbi:thiamine diphosphokinase [Desulforamulus aeronauticus]|uniref:Thiamine diphosphokinase n=1 Tax=Desulforamulus aeronauticus DSM 10349 TaxID=1121421 RepID=A0A1M6T0A8_9FIRM|nr:thiamine diphosphokinase [Desulforamulus aeronauticus]SHK50396.1 thiamine pyrophosphokinase [Desulforamulus aeronauticus DSM 10349]
MAKQRILIFSGGHLGPWALNEIEPGDFLLGVERGALYLIYHGFQPDFAMGDFDSVTPQEQILIKQGSKQFWSCDPVDKNETDTELAFTWALDQNPQEILLLGVLGSRLDHSLANVHLLVKGIAAGIPCRIVDEKNQVQLLNDTLHMQKSRFPQISLLPLTPEVQGVTLSGFQYPLDNVTLALGQSLGISNILLGANGTIRITSGLLLAIQSSD